MKLRLGWLKRLLKFGWLKRGFRKVWASKRFRRYLKIVIVLLVIYLVIVLARHHLNSPAKGTVIESPSATPTVKNTTDYTSLQTSYYSLLYPSDFLPSLQKSPEAFLDYKPFAANAESAKPSTLEIYVKPAPNGGISLDSEYKAIQSQHNIYKLSSAYYHGELVDIASRTSGGNERIALWMHNNYLLVIKISSPDKSLDIDKQLKTILSSQQWLK